MYISFHGGNVSDTPSAINEIYEYDSTGTFVGTPIDLASIPSDVVLREPRQFAFGPSDGNLYVVNAYREYNQVLRFNASGGGGAGGSSSMPFLDVFVHGSSHSKKDPLLSHPFAIAFGPAPSYDLFVSNQDTNTVSRYFGALGSPLPAPSALQPPAYPNNTFPRGMFVPPATKVGIETGLLEVRGIAFGPADSMLYVADEKESEIKVFNTSSGALHSSIRSSGALLLDPVHLLWSRDGNALYIGSKKNNEILLWDRIAQKLRVFVSQFDNGGLDGPGGMAEGPDGFLYVASRLGKQILRYSLLTGKPDEKPFIQELLDNPEFIVIV